MQRKMILYLCCITTTHNIPEELHPDNMSSYIHRISLFHVELYVERYYELLAIQPSINCITAILEPVKTTNSIFRSSKGRDQESWEKNHRCKTVRALSSLPALKHH